MKFNYNICDKDRSFWSIIKNGRLFSGFLNKKGNDVFGLNLEWNLFPFRNKFNSSLMLERTNERDYKNEWTFILKIPFLISLYITIYGMPKFLVPEKHEESTGFYLYEDHFVLKLFYKEDFLGSKIKGYYASCFLLDILKGKAKYSKREIGNEKLIIPMPEKNYIAEVTYNESQWEYPRWKTLRLNRVEVSLKEGIPYMGKGESGYDCGPDATYGMSFVCPPFSKEKVISTVVESICKSRLNYGCVDPSHSFSVKTQS